MSVQVLRSILIRSLPALVHLVLTLLFIYKLYAREQFDQILSVGLFTLITVNFITTSLVSKGQWRQLIISFTAFFMYLILYAFVIPAIGGPYEIDSGNPGDGFTGLFGISISLIALVIGTMLGIVVISLREQVKSFFSKV
ncbi:hypothetical protein [Paenibacillus agilis]|uniref:Uncharacterized protein n=1 Tax=Paenibacillus agilis TaxID=3020863 RepID=A0A559IKM7_9BACL|nr:hypothetical protein [Paenibacillus agilis]TVX88209.1 hypothetical protein FPZ44_20105 [Paenibacillus agilis]